MPSSVWSRHPRFTLSILVALCMTTLVLLGQNNFQGGDSHSHFAISLKDDSLSARLERADHIYNKVLKDRQGLIQKFGPSASDVVPSVSYIFNLLSFAPNVYSQFPSRSTSLARIHNLGFLPTSLQLSTRSRAHR